MLKLERARSLSEAVTARLRAEIVEGEFRLGEVLSESKIAARYQVSRTPVREAFACLGLEGLILTEPQQGTFVFTMDREDFAQMSETRSILETAALSLAMERNRSRLVKQWTRLVSGMEAAMKTDNGKRYSRYDGEFHQTLFSLSANPYLALASQSFAAKIAAVRNRLGAHPEHMKHSYEQHAELLRLVRDGDFKSAAKLLETHIRFKGESFWAAADKIEEETAAARGQRSQTSRIAL